VAGQIIQNLFPKQTKYVFTRFKLSKLGSVCLLVIIWQTYDQAFSSGAFQSVKPSNIIFIVFMSIALFFIFLAVCFFTSILWLPRQDTISVCYCVPAKTPAMGVPLANVMFIGLSAQLESKIQIPMVIYQVRLSSVLSLPNSDGHVGATDCSRKSPHHGFPKMDTSRRRG
jgi:sodium/bile acid cotransporter 7